MRMDKDLLAHGQEFRRALANHQYEVTDEGGILFPRQRVTVEGIYEHAVNGKDVRQDKNLVVTEGLNHILSSALDAGTQIAAWYMALYAGNVSPAAGWTAANFATNATEITSTTEGFAGLRKGVTFAAPAGGVITNAASKAEFTMVSITAAVLDVNGVGIMSVDTRGATTGTLLSSVKFSATRNLQNGDVFSVGYTLTLG